MVIPKKIEYNRKNEGVSELKSILFVRNLKTEEDASAIREALQETRVEYSIVLDRKAVVVEGNSDVLHAAKVAIREAGYVIE